MSTSKRQFEPDAFAAYWWWSLTREEITIIGDIVVYWAQIDYATFHLAAALVEFDRDRETKLERLEGQNVDQKLKKIRNVVERNSELRGEILDDLNNIIQRIEEAQKKRDIVVHGRLERDKNGNTGFFSARTRQWVHKADLKQVERELGQLSFDVLDLAALVHDALLPNEEIERLMELVFPDEPSN